MATFPSLRPSSREFSIGEYAVKTYQSLSGKTVRRAFGNRPYNHALTLEFANVGQVDLESIFNHYHTQKGTSTGFDLPAEIFEGYSGAFATSLRQTNSGVGLWYYAEPPSVKSVYKDISTISVRLINQL